MSRFAIGVDLGGTNLRVAAVDESGTILEKRSSSVKLLSGREAVIQDLATGVRILSERHATNGVLAGVGIGVPGILYAATGLLRQSPNLPGWENFPIRSEIRALLGVPVQVNNDANVAALGEKWMGAGREVDSLCLLTLGTGLGGGLIFHNQIWEGFLGMAGEIGHIPIRDDGAPCGCGSRGCLETEVSATAVVRNAKELIDKNGSAALAEQARHGVPLTAELVYQLGATGDPGCRELYDSFGRYLGTALASLVNTLNLPLYVLGGGVAAAWDLFSAAMLRELRSRSYVFAEGSTRVEASLLAGDAGLYGAAYLALSSQDAQG